MFNTITLVLNFCMSYVIGSAMKGILVTFVALPKNPILNAIVKVSISVSAYVAATALMTKLTPTLKQEMGNLETAINDIKDR